MYFKVVKNLTESLSTHSKLNPAIFDDNDIMKKDVRERLIEIADLFVSKLKEKKIPLKVYDYWIVGSNAAYNYTEGVSDLDVHVIFNTDTTNISPELLQTLYDYAKVDFNDKHDIYVKGQPVELYLESINTSAISNGIYSLKKNKWVKKPEPLKDEEIRIEDTPEYDKWQERYWDIQDSQSIDEIQKFIDDLYLMRKESLAKDGEFGIGNLIFKEFRNVGRLQKLKDEIAELEDKELTLEGLDSTDRNLRVKRSCR